MKTREHLAEFNTRVERLRAVTGRNWAEIARALEVSRTMLHYYRNGQHPPDAPVLYRLAEAERGLPAAPPPVSRRTTLPSLTGANAGSRQQLLSWLRQLRHRQQEVVATAQRHQEEIEGWIAEVEQELADTAFTGELEADHLAESLHTGSDPAPVVLRDIASVSLPIFGQLPAGWPQTREGVASQRPARTATVPKGRFPDGAFGLDVRGDSMNAAGPHPILDGDTVVLLSPELRVPRVGDIVAALIDGETCLKRLVRRGGPRRGAAAHHLRSESCNPVHGELYPAHDLVIQGVVVGKL